MNDLGELLNTIERPINPCPRCGVTERMRVYVKAVRWRCGHTVGLPPIAPAGKQSRWQMRTAQRE